MTVISALQTAKCIKFCGLRTVQCKLYNMQYTLYLHFEMQIFTLHNVGAHFAREKHTEDIGYSTVEEASSQLIFSKAIALHCSRISNVIQKIAAVQ